MSFQTKLRELRESAKLSQAELADLAGLSKGGIADLEQGRNQPTWESVRKLAKALGVTCQEFDVDSEPASKGKPGRGRPKRAAESPKPVTAKKQPKIKD